MKEVPLGALTEAGRSIAYGVVQPGDDPGDGVPLIRAGDVSDGRVATDGLRTVTHEVSRAFARTVLKGGELLVSLVGNPGEVAIAPPNLAGANLSRQVAMVALNGTVDAKYVKFYLSSERGRAQLFMRTGGAVQQVINLADLKTIPIVVPDLGRQQRVASCLSNFDDLIDNNRRRIKLLEDSVRLLFDEWFITAASSAWPISTLAQLCAEDAGIQTGPFGSQLHQSDYSDEGVPVVMPKDLATMRIDTTTVARIPEHLADELGRHRMRRGDIVFGRRGEIGRRAYIGHRQAGFFCGTGCLRLRPDPERVHPRFLFEVLRAPAVAGDIANRAKGSTMANLSAGALQDVAVPVPPRALQDRFAAFAEDVGEQIDTLDEQSRKLRTARDLLLPRLMSGELSA